MAKSEAQDPQAELSDRLQRAISGNVKHERVAVKLQQFGVEPLAILEVIENLEERSAARAQTVI